MTTTGMTVDEVRAAMETMDEVRALVNKLIDSDTLDTQAYHEAVKVLRATHAARTVLFDKLPSGRTETAKCCVSVMRSIGAAGVFDPCSEPVTVRDASGSAFCAEHSRLAAASEAR